MSIIRWNPNLASMPHDLISMQREMNRLFDGFFRDGLQEDAFSSVWAPAVDVSERDNEYVVNVELPGVSRDDVNIVMENNVLTIRGEKKQKNEETKGNVHRIERTYGSFQRSFTIPATIRSEKIDANFKDGVLTVTLPKDEGSKPKQIEVKVK
jgi:HSP20 family protein